MRELPDNLHNQLLLAAEVFADRGFDATRIEDVAEATGIPKATLYYYFRGKADILGHLLGVMLERVRDRVKDATSVEGSPPVRLDAVIRAQLGVMAESPATCRALVAELGRAGRMPETAAVLNEAFDAPVRALLVEGAADGTLRSDLDAATAAASLFGAVTMAGLREISTTGALDAHRLADDLVPLVLHGMAGSGT